jgi:hypothetical protein
MTHTKLNGQTHDFWMEMLVNLPLLEAQHSKGGTSDFAQASHRATCFSPTGHSAAMGLFSQLDRAQVAANHDASGWEASPFASVSCVAGSSRPAT